MAGKRSASSELNHDNWNDECETEECGTFQRATDDVLKQRIIKTAKRRNTTLQSENNENSTTTKSIFSNFAGFGQKPNTQQQSSSPFSFFSNVNKNNNTNGTTESESEPDGTKKSDEKSVEYYAKLRSLNESVSKWIKTHVDKNPLCILTPVFNDYDRYLKEIEIETETKTKLETKSKLNTNETKTETEPKTKEPDSKSFLFKNQNESNTNTNLFKSDSNSNSNSFTFGNKTQQQPAFSFGAVNKPFSFTNTEAKPVEEPEDEEPPKPEFKPVVEDDSLYSIRCKVFVKNSTEFADRGVGQLYLKSVPDSDKSQLIVRADTNLGNLLLNLILSESVPTKRMGKNNVMLVCVPTPDTKPPPVPVLLRVKTGDEADKLLEVLNKHKK